MHRAAPGRRSDAGDTFYQGTSLGDEWLSLGYVNHDITLFKNFAMASRRNLQIRVEMYNAFNTTQYSGVDTSAEFNFATGVQTDTAFGRVTGSARELDPRHPARRAVHVLVFVTRSRRRALVVRRQDGFVSRPPGTCS